MTQLGGDRGEPLVAPQITPDMSQLDAALAYASAGIYVFPADHPELPQCAGVKTAEHEPITCDKRGKHPVVKWDTGASTSVHNIHHWWAGSPRNVGIHCGKSGLLVIDEDAPGEFARFAADLGVPPPDTYTVTTASGKHYYFQDTEAGALGNREGAFRDYHINVRSGRGYVIAAGSVHETGITYAANGVRTIAPLPGWVREAIQGQRRTNGSDPFTDSQSPPEGFELPEVIKEGHRDEVLYRFACSLRAQTLNYPTAKLLFQEAFQRCEQPPTAKTSFTWDQALAKLKGAYSRYDEGRSDEYAKTRGDGQQGDSDKPGGGSRWVDLRPYLEGTRVRPDPNVGGARDDEIQLLYPKRWHTNIALTGAGKTAFALWHAKAILDAGGHVVYLHFEEPEPDGTIDRLISFGMARVTIDERFHWAACDKKWAPDEMVYRLSQLKESPALAILDGINAACSQHGWVHGDPSAIGLYRAMFVTPLVQAGAAVLSLGHPPKARDRQNEMHGYGSTAWLDEVDGVGFRMVAAKEHPMEAGGKGYSELYVVKDRYSQVKRWGNVDTTKDQPWYYMGAFIVDDTGAPTDVRLNVPPRAGSVPKSREAILAGHIVEALRRRSGRFESVRNLQAMLGDDAIKYTTGHLEVALEMLVNREQLEWPTVSKGNPRPGWLAVDSSGGVSE